MLIKCLLMMDCGPAYHIRPTADMHILMVINSRNGPEAPLRWLEWSCQNAVGVHSQNAPKQYTPPADKE